jgi:hypothetical protein
VGVADSIRVESTLRSAQQVPHLLVEWSYGVRPTFLGDLPLQSNANDTWYLAARQRTPIWIFQDKALPFREVRPALRRAVYCVHLPDARRSDIDLVVTGATPTPWNVSPLRALAAAIRKQQPQGKPRCFTLCLGVLDLRSQSILIECLASNLGGLKVIDNAKVPIIKMIDWCPSSYLPFLPSSLGMRALLTHELYHAGAPKSR